ncbi:nitrite reductase small subunit NirD [Glycomyces buryatensis]|uniref:Nitrite reductase small subunit NirD n=1 Tax=Glycomyces buryatensis TaxID=2570927 RepID=A0A4S8QIP2_9ACTN|nr:nitrite reductase small subunit NirD [Glycomyces buryatensis]THV43631.1 nitrite reductase small subunit NirD [Glycomyces buryatensis]
MESICEFDRLIPGRGAAALLGDGAQVAVFRLGDGSLFAVSNLDPFSGANVMSRGIVGDRGGEPTVASPLLKQVFSLKTGRCLDDESASLDVFAVEVVDGEVRVGATADVKASALWSAPPPHHVSPRPEPRPC